MTVKKVKKSKSKTNEKPVVNSKDTKEKSTRKEVLDVPDSAIPIVESITENVIKIVVGKLKPDIEVAVNSRFDEIKKIVTSEVQDIRTTIENKLPSQTLEQTQVNEKVAQSPSNEIRGLENNSMRNPPKAQSNAMESLLPSLLQLLPSILGKSPEPTPQNNMPQMLVELMMKKFVNDMGRSDTQNQAVTDYLLKQMVKRDPSILKGLADNNLKSESDGKEHF